MTIYETLQTILYTYVLPGSVPTSSLAVELCCTLGSLFVIAIPFLIVWRVIRLIGGR